MYYCIAYYIVEFGLIHLRVIFALDWNRRQLNEWPRGISHQQRCRKYEIPWKWITVGWKITRDRMMRINYMAWHSQYKTCLIDSGHFDNRQSVHIDTVYRWPVTAFVVTCLPICPLAWSIFPQPQLLSLCDQFEVQYLLCRTWDMNTLPAVLKFFQSMCPAHNISRLCPYM